MNGKKIIVTLGMICACLFVKGETAQAQVIENDKTAQVDLDGDGTKEEILFKAEGEHPCKATVYVNNEKIYSAEKDAGYWATLTVLDLDSADKTKELYVEFVAENDCFVYGNCARYENGKWKSHFTFAGKDASTARLKVLDKHLGNKKVEAEIEFYNQYAMQGYATRFYTVNSKGELKGSSKTILNTTKSWRKQKYRTTKAVKVTKKIGDKTAAFTMKKGTRYYVYKVKLKNKNTAEITHIYVKTADDKKGWVKIPNSPFCEGYNKYNTDSKWSDYAYSWG